LIETEESYTCRGEWPFAPSFLDGENLPNYGEKLMGLETVRKKNQAMQRGLGGFPHERLHQDSAGAYKTGNNWYINPDCNGAANIITKVSRKLGLNLSRLCRGTLTCPQRVYLWSACEETKQYEFILLRSINLESL